MKNNKSIGFFGQSCNFPEWQIEIEIALDEYLQDWNTEQGLDLNITTCSALSLSEVVLPAFQTEYALLFEKQQDIVRSKHIDLAIIIDDGSEWTEQTWNHIEHISTIAKASCFFMPLKATSSLPELALAQQKTGFTFFKGSPAQFAKYILFVLSQKERVIKKDLRF